MIQNDTLSISDKDKHYQIENNINMSNGEVDSTALIISVCVIVPALIAITVCAIIYCAQRNKNRKFHRQTTESIPYEYEYPRERPPQDTYIIDFTRANRYQQQRRQPPPISEQAPPAYDTTIVRTRTQPVPLYSSVRTISSSANIRRTSPIITPSIYSAMPPSYAEIFLSPQTLPNG